MEFKREQYLSLMHGERADRQMFVELFGPLIGLDEEWRKQGASEEEINMTAFDWDYVPIVDCGGNALLYGQIAEPGIIEETAEYITEIDALGRRTKMCKGISTIGLPQSYPVTDMQSWLKIKHLFEYDNGRINVLQMEKARAAQGKGAVVMASIPGGFDFPRMLMGEENACMAYYLQPELIFDIMNTLKDTCVKVFSKITESLKVDQLMVHEDLAGKSGPLVGPMQIEKFIKPYFSSVWEIFKNNGTTIFQMDSDGDIRPVIDSFMDCGLNSFYPMEPAAGVDMVEMRKKYGMGLMMAGGIDKHILRETKNDIRRELEYKMQPLMQKGGIVFGLDHRITNGTPIENYRYYVDLGREILGIPPINPKQKGWRRMAFCGATSI